MAGNGVELNDQYVVLLERNLEESRRLREENSRILQTLQEERAENRELRNMLTQQNQATTPSPNRRKRASVEVPTPCKRKTRDLYNELLKKDDFEGFKFDERFGSAHNKAVTDRICKAVKDVCHEAYSSLFIEEAIRVYFKSLKDSTKRREQGTANAHKIRCRRQIRLREKCENLRKGAAYAKDWTEEAKKQAQEILRPELMSSEESAMEMDEDGNEETFFKVKKLPWERKKMRELKKKLKKSYRKSLSERQKRLLVTRKRVDEESTRPVPENAPAWAVRLPAAPDQE